MKKLLTSSRVLLTIGLLLWLVVPLRLVSRWIWAPSPPRYFDFGITDQPLCSFPWIFDGDTVWTHCFHDSERYLTKLDLTTSEGTLLAPAPVIFEGFAKSQTGRIAISDYNEILLINPEDGKTERPPVPTRMTKPVGFGWVGDSLELASSGEVYVASMPVGATYDPLLPYASRFAPKTGWVSRNLPTPCEESKKSCALIRAYPTSQGWQLIYAQMKNEREVKLWQGSEHEPFKEAVTFPYPEELEAGSLLNGRLFSLTLDSPVPEIFGNIYDGGSVPYRPFYLKDGALLRVERPLQPGKKSKLPFLLPNAVLGAGAVEWLLEEGNEYLVGERRLTQSYNPNTKESSFSAGGVSGPIVVRGWGPLAIGPSADGGYWAIGGGPVSLDIAYLRLDKELRRADPLSFFERWNELSTDNRRPDEFIERDKGYKLTSLLVILLYFPVGFLGLLLRGLITKDKERLQRRSKSLSISYFVVWGLCIWWAWQLVAWF